MSNVKSPFFSSRFLFFPRGGHNIVVDFWANFFALSEVTNPNRLVDFPKKIADCLGYLGYGGSINAKLRMTSLSGTFIGVGREMLVYYNSHAKVVVYMKPVADFYYVSMRVIYPQPFSLLKIARFILIVVGLILFSAFADALNNYTMFGSTSLWDEFVWSMTKIDWLLPRIVGTLSSILLFIIWGLISWIRKGMFLGFLREDFHEIYRDDLASIGYAVYTAIMTAADELSLHIANPDEAAPPSFGTGLGTAISRRPSRI